MFEIIQNNSYKSILLRLIIHYFCDFYWECFFHYISIGLLTMDTMTNVYQQIYNIFDQWRSFFNEYNDILPSSIINTAFDNQILRLSECNLLIYVDLPSLIITKAFLYQLFQIKNIKSLDIFLLLMKFRNEEINNVYIIKIYGRNIGLNIQ